MTKKLRLFVFRVVTASFLISCLPDVYHGQTKPMTSYEKSKSVQTNKLLTIVEKLEQVATLNSRGANGKHTNGYLSQASINQIKRLLAELADSEQITKLGLICGHIAYPQNAEHVAYDAVFDWAIWEAAGRLAQRTDDDAIRGLELLKQSFGTDGHPAEEFRELIVKQQTLRAKTQKDSR